MLIRKPEPFRYSEITPKSLFYNRRQFLAQASAAIAAMAAPLSAATKLTGLQKSPFSTTDKPNTFQQVTTYNNFYEFGTDKSDPSHNAKNFKTEPWTVSIEGAVAKPRKFTIEEIRKLAPLEERVYRLRCVEAWSAIVPWVGYSFSTLLNAVSPTSKAKYVAFETFFDARQMPEAAGLHFPYVEGLRLDEAMHPLTLLAVGLYDDWLPPQNGAPVRMVIPWKYGFKGAKSLVKIRLVEDQPPTSWNIANSREYGFYSNVNPDVDHPRWSQKTERRLGEFARRPTVIFNGYGDQVAKLYAGMDLRKYF